jgi:hypothetical protein
MLLETWRLGTLRGGSTTGTVQSMQGAPRACRMRSSLPQRRAAVAWPERLPAAASRCLKLAGVALLGETAHLAA